MKKLEKVALIPLKGGLITFQDKSTALESHLPPRGTSATQKVIYIEDVSNKFAYNHGSIGGSSSSQ